MSIFRRKQLKKGELRNIDVDLVSLLFDDMKPANGKSAIFKDTDGKRYRECLSSTKFKSDDGGRLFVTVLEPGVKDLQGDIASESEVLMAMENFSKKGMLRKNDINHNMQPTESAFVSENYILKAEDKDHYPDTVLKSWVQVIKLDTNSAEWKKVKAKQFNGVSLFGHADDLGDNVAFEKAIGELNEVLKSLQKSGDDASVKAAAEIEKKIKEMEKKASESDSDAATKELVKAMNELVGSLNKAVSKSINSEPGDDIMKDEEFTIKGEKILVKAFHKDISKAWATDGDPKSIQILNENNAEQFIDEVLETKDDETLKEITVAHLDKDNKIDTGLIDDIILKNALDGTPTAQEITDSELTISPQILCGTYKLGKSTTEEYEEKFGIERYLAWALNKLRNKVLKAVKKLLFKGDRDSGTPALAGLNGVLALATDASDVTDLGKTTYDTWEERFEQVLLAFDEDMLEHQENFKIYVSMKDMIRVRSEAKKAGNVINGRLQIDGKSVYFDDVQIKPRFMTDDYVIAGITKFIIIGVRADADVYREFIPWYYYWYVRMRTGITYITGFVKVFHLLDGS